MRLFFYVILTLLCLFPIRWAFANFNGGYGRTEILKKECTMVPTLGSTFYCQQPRGKPARHMGKTKTTFRRKRRSI